MAFLLNQAKSLSLLRSNPQKAQESLYLPHRAFHVEPGPREKALLAEDASLKRFKSHKKGVWRIKRMGDILTIVVVTGCCYEIYVRATMREEARKQAGGSA